MADRLAEQGSIQFAQESTAAVGTVSRLAGAGQIEAEIRRLVDEGFYTQPVSALTVKGRLINAALAAFSPIRLFSAGEQGAWYDPSDYSTLFQDAAGTTPVTAIEQPVGLMLDKSKGSSAIGSERISNNTFDSDTVWTKGTGWAIGSGVATKTAGTASLLSQPVTLTVGKTYRVIYTITRTAGTIVPRFTGGTDVTGTSRAASGTYADFLTAVTGNNTFDFSADASFAGTVDNVYIKEVTGNDAYQLTATARPVLRARYNKILNSGFAGAATGTPGTAPTSWSFVASTGTTDSVSVSDGAGGFRLTYSVSSTRIFVGQSVSISANEVIDHVLTIYANTDLTFIQIFALSGPPAGSSTSYFANGVSVASNYRPVANDVITIRLTNSTTAGSYNLRVGAGVSNNATGTVTFGKCDVRTVNDGLGMPSYQRVTTATDYDVVNFKPYLAFDGSDDWLVTNSIDFTGTDKMTVWAGVRKLSDAAQAMITELSATITGNAGAFALLGPHSVLTNRFIFNSRGSATQVSATATGASYDAPVTGVLTGIGDISGDQVILRVNGTQTGIGTSDQGTGNYGNYPLYIGRRGGTTLPFNGRLYGLIIRGAQSTNAEITNTESWMNNKTGAY